MLLMLSQAKVEAYNETNRGSYQQQQAKRFLELNPNIGKQFQHTVDQKDDQEDGLSDDEEEH